MQTLHKKFTLTFCFVLVVITLINTYHLTAMDYVPNEVVRMFLEHMTQKQRRSVARVGNILNFLVNTFPQTIVITTEEDRDNTEWDQSISAVMTENEFSSKPPPKNAFNIILRYPTEEAGIWKCLSKHDQKAIIKLRDTPNRQSTFLIQCSAHVDNKARTYMVLFSSAR